jgi:hypothetical protein
LPLILFCFFPVFIYFPILHILFASNACIIFLLFFTSIVHVSIIHAFRSVTSTAVLLYWYRNLLVYMHNSSS